MLGHLCEALRGKYAGDEIDKIIVYYTFHNIPNKMEKQNQQSLVVRLTFYFKLMCFSLTRLLQDDVDL